MSFEGGVVLTDPVKPSKSKKGSKKAGKAPVVGQQKAPQVTVEAKVDPEDTTHRVTLHKHLRKTRFCMYHFQGACQFGTDCSFAHNLSEMHQTPDLRKTQLCKSYSEGECTDPTCTFAHGDDELRSTEMFFKKTLCIWNEKGKCRNAEKCRFAHGVKEMRARATTEIAGVPEEPVAAQGNNRRQKGSKQDMAPMATNIMASMATADPMKINPGNYGQFDQGFVGQPAMPAPQVAPAAVNTTGTNSNLNGELATLCQSIAILTAQCNNIQKRMELEQEFSNIQRQSESMGMTPQGYPMPGQAPTYQGYTGQMPPGMGLQSPLPPGLNALPGVQMPPMIPGVAEVLQNMQTMPQMGGGPGLGIMSPGMAEVLQNMKGFY